MLLSLPIHRPRQEVWEQVPGHLPILGTLEGGGGKQRATTSPALSLSPWPQQGLRQAQLFKCLSLKAALQRERAAKQSVGSGRLKPFLGHPRSGSQGSDQGAEAPSSSVLPVTLLRGNKANLRASPWSQGEVGADFDRSSSDGELPEVGCGDSAPAMS